MSTSTQVNKLKINTLTKEQYSSIVPSDTELYFVLDEEENYLPSQEGQAGKYLTTNGNEASWVDVWGSMSVDELDGSGTLLLEDNSLYKLTSSGDIVFSLPTISDTSKFHQIMVQFKMSTVVTINAGTSYYFDSEAPDLSKAGNYNFVWEYDNIDSHWVFGAISKGTA